jgi:hypothetical protein
LPIGGAKAVFSGMRSFLVLILNPLIDIRLQFGYAGIEFLKESDLLELV